MEHAARRPLLAAATLTTATALALSPISVAPLDLHAPSISPAAISTRAVHLTDAWSSLLTDTANSVYQLAGMLTGSSATAPLPTRTIFLAPIATQLVLNQFVYLTQLFSGQGGQIPGEISTHLQNIVQIAVDLSTELPPVFAGQLQAPLLGLSAAVESLKTATNPLTGLLEAPAVFLDFTLNTDYGLLGRYGILGVPIIIRNGLAVAIDPPLPAWLSHLLQPAKGAATTAASLKVAAPTHAASSKRSKTTVDSSATTSHHSTGTGHSKHQ